MKPRMWRIVIWSDLTRQGRQIATGRTEWSQSWPSLSRPEATSSRWSSWWRRSTSSQARTGSGGTGSWCKKLKRWKKLFSTISVRQSSPWKRSIRLVKAHPVLFQSLFHFWLNFRLDPQNEQLWTCWRHLYFRFRYFDDLLYRFRSNLWSRLWHQYILLIPSRFLSGCCFCSRFHVWFLFCLLSGIFVSLNLHFRLP